MVEDPGRAAQMGAAGRARVAEHFSLAAFGAHLEAAIRGTARRSAARTAAGGA